MESGVLLQFGVVAIQVCVFLLAFILHVVTERRSWSMTLKVETFLFWISMLLGAVVLSSSSILFLRSNHVRSEAATQFFLIVIALPAALTLGHIALRRIGIRQKRGLAQSGVK